MAHSIITSKGQITIPKKIREKIHLNSGDKVDFIIEDGIIKLIPLTKSVSEVFGILARKGQKAVSVEEMKIKLDDHFKNKI